MHLLTTSRGVSVVDVIVVVAVVAFLVFVAMHEFPRYEPLEVTPSPAAQG